MNDEERRRRIVELASQFNKVVMKVKLVCPGCNGYVPSLQGNEFCTNCNTFISSKKLAMDKTLAKYKL